MDAGRAGILLAQVRYWFRCVSREPVSAKVGAAPIIYDGGLQI
jgi:hypothetical protein